MMSKTFTAGNVSEFLCHRFGNKVAGREDKAPSWRLMASAFQVRFQLRGGE